MSIDLELGEPEETPSQRRRRIKRTDEKAAPKTKPTEREDRSLTGQLDTVFTKIADMLRARDDEELAEAIRDERHAMSQGLVSLTSSVTFLRPLLTLVLALIEPFLAFWRVGRILFHRFLNWRASRPAPVPMEETEMDASGIVQG